MNTIKSTETVSCLHYGICHWDWLWIGVVGAMENDFGVRIIHSTISGEVIIFWEGDNLMSWI